MLAIPIHRAWRSTALIAAKSGDSFVGCLVWRKMVFRVLAIRRVESTSQYGSVLSSFARFRPVLENVIKRGRRHGTRQHPLERLSAMRARFCNSVNGKCVKLA